MYYTSEKYAHVDYYHISKVHESIFEVLKIYENPALVLMNNGNIIVYNMARVRSNLKILNKYLKDLCRRYKCKITVRDIQRAYKAGTPLYISELNFLAKESENGI